MHKTNRLEYRKIAMCPALIRCLCVSNDSYMIVSEGSTACSWVSADSTVNTSSPTSSVIAD